jgi:Zn-dependent peptidase ImmA (M78 family)
MSQKLKIGGSTYKVRRNRRPFSDAELCYGFCDYGRSVITLAKFMKRSHRRATLWHEVIHVILHQAGYADHDEQMVTALANGIVQVLQDNPEMRDA